MNTKLFGCGIAVGLAAVTMASARFGEGVQDEKPQGSEAQEARHHEHGSGILDRVDVERARGQADRAMLEPGEESSYAQRLAGDDQLRASLGENPKFEQLREGLPQIEVDGETFFVAEGDLLLDEDQLLFYADRRQAQEQLFEARARAGEVALPSAVSSGEGASQLVGIVVNNRLVRWAPDVVLRYCVLRGTFVNQQRHQTVVDNMLRATAEWEAICGVDFEYVPALDASPGTTTPSGAVFSVREINAGGEFIAAAFFPNDPPRRRRIVIDPSYFSTTFDRVGILRHELGHVLGFRHEHIRSEAPAVCPDESTGSTFNLTNYDPQSVMHYFCGGFGNRALAFSPLDRQGAQLLYGPPLETLSFIGLD